MDQIKGAVTMLGIISANEKIEKSTTEIIQELEPKLKRITTLPDRFNELFADRGWIMYEKMDGAVAEAAIKKANSDDIDGAEIDLADYYTEYILRINIKRMKDIEAFRPRWHLTQKALNDYLEGRYYACVHVIQAVLDGMVNEIYLKAYGHHRGFYANDTDLTACDSISAHSNGLTLLAKTLCRGRNKTRTEGILIPYRHGIVHGTDLDYDNKIVAAKIWAALFATRSWAMMAEKGELDVPRSRKKVISLYNAPNREPRVIKLGQETPINGLPENYIDGTPEKRLAEYLTHWVNKRFDKMIDYIPLNHSNNEKVSPREIEKTYNKERLHLWEYKEIKDTSDARTEIKVILRFKEVGEMSREPTEHVFFMINMHPIGWIAYNWDWINFQ
jgi:hypothetical protein